jgi:hypothetical protein
MGRWKRTRRGRSRIAGVIDDGRTALCGRATVMSGVATGLRGCRGGYITVVDGLLRYGSPRLEKGRVEWGF